MHHNILLPTFGLEDHTAIMIYLMIGLAVFSYLFTSRISLVPGKLQSMLEVVIEGLEDLVNETMGHKGKKYLPFIVAIFLYILIANALGFVPGLIPPTANLNTTVGLALVVFFATHIIGIREQGLTYLKQFMGPIWWMAPLMIPLEIIGHLARPLSLSLRLFGNMMGHEQIVGVLLLQMPAMYPVLAFSTALGMLVIFIQAFVFTLLSMLYIGGALEEHH